MQCKARCKIHCPCCKVSENIWIFVESVDVSPDTLQQASISIDYLYFSPVNHYSSAHM